MEQDHVLISKTQPLHRTDPESGTGWIGRTPPCGALGSTEADQNLLQAQLGSMEHLKCLETDRKGSG